jgi:hypothetical protein
MKASGARSAGWHHVVRANLGFRFASPQALCYRVLRTLVLDSVPFDLISDLVNPVNPVFSS